ncbi:MAG: hypothetical protein M1836_006967 [Candelina mexicana]|nr:MAG: hypothetical protein M1836_006967 [Candelina mexicana]
MDLWSKALESLEPDDKQHFPVLQGKPQDILTDILKEVQAKRDTAHKKRWKFTKSNGSTIILRDVFEKIVHTVTSCARAVDVAVSTAPLHAAPPWAIIRFLLQVSTMDLGAFCCMSEGVENITCVIARYEIIERLYLHPTTAPTNGDSKLLNDCVIKVYIKILRYLVKAKKFWSENTAKRIVKSPFTDMEAENNVLQAAIKKADDEVYRITSLLQDKRRSEKENDTREALERLLKDTTSPIVRMAQDVSDIKDMLDGSQRREILHWLSTVPCELQHAEAARKVVNGTGQWLLDRPELLEWQCSSTSALFWLHGIPGAGKSKLTSIVIESFIQQHQKSSTPPPPLAYFYCSNRGTDVRSRDSLEILCALLRQLTGRDTRLPLRGSVALEFVRRKQLYEGAGAQVPRLTREEAVMHILNIAADDPIIIIIDALDEANDAQRGDLFAAFEQILQKAQNVVKIFVSSRTDWDIVDSFEQHSNVGIKEEMNSEDIKTFTKYKIQEAIETKRLLRGRVSPSLRNDIMKALIDGAQGMFRWVELSIETLSNSRRLALEKDVRSELGKLPAELKEQYRVIYMDILDSAPATSSIAVRTFSWMLAAQRTMTVEEMIAAVALDDDGSYHTDLSIPKLLDICRNLLIVTSIGQASEQRTFQMAHLSVREFLEELEEFSAQHIHTIATSRLLANYGLNLGRKEKGSVEQEPVKVLRDYTTYLFEHAEMSFLIEPECDLAYTMRSFLFDYNYEPTKMLTEWHHLIEEFHERSFLPKDLLDLLDLPLYHKRQSDDLGAGGLRLICIHGLLSVFRSLGDVEKIPWRSKTDFSYGTVIYQATTHDKLTVAKLLLLEEYMFHPDETNNHASALYDAVWEKREEMVGLLLEHGANPLLQFGRGFHDTPWNCVFSTRFKYGTGYNFNIFKHMFESIESLLTKDHDISSTLGFDWKREGLFEALRANWEEVSQFLIQRGANDCFDTSRRKDAFLAESERHSSTLQIAAGYSDYTIVRALLDRSLEHSASSGPSKHRTYLNYLDPYGRSVLHYLMIRESRIAEGSEAIMKLLLEHGVDTTIICNRGFTTLHIAASIGSIDVMRELSENSRQLEAQTIKGATLLHIASGGTHQNPELIRYLTDIGQNPLARDSTGSTPLHYAASVCNNSTLKALLKVVSGVDDLNRSGLKCSTTVNITDNEGKSLLHIAGTQRYISDYNENDQAIREIRLTVSLLVGLGADLNMRTGGKTPLMSLLASPRRGHNGYLSAANELLGRGADPNIRDSAGSTPLHYIAEHYTDQERMVDLLAAGANIEARDHKSRTPLHLASMHTRPLIVLFLLLRYAGFEARDRTGATPLHYATKNILSDEVVVMLIKQGANIDSADDSGATPLHWAAKAGSQYAVDLLTHYGANPEVTDKDGKTAKDYASNISEHSDEDEEYSDEEAEDSDEFAEYSSVKAGYGSEEAKHGDSDTEHSS